MKKSFAAVKPSPTGNTVLENILIWSNDKPAWQRDALRRIVSKRYLDAQEVQDLVELCKQGRRGGSVLKAIPLEAIHLPANPTQGGAVSLISVADVSAVNNLAASQTLTFEGDGFHSAVRNWSNSRFVLRAVTMNCQSFARCASTASQQ
jgi:hypothetical protein